MARWPPGGGIEMELSGREPGFDIPALPGMDLAEVFTPCLILDLDALEANLRKLGDYVAARGLRLRSHGKMHKSVDIQRLQEEIGGASGVCCQKVSEAEVFARAGIRDILVTNEVRNLRQIDRLARLPLLGATLGVCVDDRAAIAPLSVAAQRHGTELSVLVELDCGQGRCGVADIAEVVAMAQTIAAAPGLRFGGVQAYHGGLQHVPTREERARRFAAVAVQVEATVAALTAAGLAPELVTGAGSGSYYLEGASGVFNELQCGSYAFMDADYGRVEGEDGRRLDAGTWRNALFVLTSVLSDAGPERAVVDAGLKALAVDSGLPVIHGRDDVHYAKVNDEHGIIDDPGDVLRVGERLRLVPGHCDPTCNLHDWYVGVRGGVVECVWPVSARGRLF